MSPDKEFNSEVCETRNAEISRRFSELKEDIKDFEKLVHENNIKSSQVASDIDHLRDELNKIELRHKDSVQSAISLGLTDGKIKDEMFEAAIKDISSQMTVIWARLDKLYEGQGDHNHFINKWKYTIAGAVITLTVLWGIFELVLPYLIKWVK